MKSLTPLIVELNKIDQTLVYNLIEDVQLKAVICMIKETIWKWKCQQNNKLEEI